MNKHSFKEYIGKKVFKWFDFYRHFVWININTLPCLQVLLSSILSLPQSAPIGSQRWCTLLRCICTPVSSLKLCMILSVSFNSVSMNDLSVHFTMKTHDRKWVFSERTTTIVMRTYSHWETQLDVDTVLKPGDPWNMD